jgi:hypothetical protein
MNKQKMKKFFMKGTEDELQFGDLIELDLTKDMPNGKVKHHHLDCKFIPELIPLLLDAEVIDAVDEEEEKKETLDFQEGCPLFEDVLEANKALELKVEHLEAAVDVLKESIANLIKKVSKKSVA